MIGAIGDPPSAAILEDGSARHTQDWPDQSAAYGSHGSRAGSARSPKEPQQQRLGLIFKIMSDSDESAAKTQSRPFEKIVSRPPGCVLHPLPAPSGDFVGTSGFDYDRNSQLQSHFPDEIRVSSALNSQPVVEVRNAHIECQLMTKITREMEKRRGIRSSGNGHDNAVAGSHARIFDVKATHLAFDAISLQDRQPVK